MPVFSFFVHFSRLISTKIRIIWKPYGGKEQFRSELAKKGRAWARAGSGGRRERAAGHSPCGPLEAMTALCLTTVRLALARLKGRSSPSSSRCRSLFRHPERRNCSFPTGLPQKYGKPKITERQNRRNSARDGYRHAPCGHLASQRIRMGQREARKWGDSAP